MRARAAAVVLDDLQCGHRCDASRILTTILPAGSPDGQPRGRLVPAHCLIIRIVPERANHQISRVLSEFEQSQRRGNRRKTYQDFISRPPESAGVSLRPRSLPIGGSSAKEVCLMRVDVIGTGIAGNAAAWAQAECDLNSVRVIRDRTRRVAQPSRAKTRWRTSMFADLKPASQ